MSLLLVGSLTACGGGDAKSSLTTPELFYLRPHGDPTGPEGKERFRVQATDKEAPSGYGAQDHELTVDVSGSEKVVRLEVAGAKKGAPRCEGDAVKVVCKVNGDYDTRHAMDRVLPVAAEGSRAGQRGQVRFRFSTEKGETLTARTRVVVGEPVVEVREPARWDDVTPGAEVGVPVVVRNRGEVATEGIALMVGGRDGVTFRTRHRGCRYGEQNGENVSICFLPDVRIPPGRTVVLRPEVQVRASTTQMYGFVSLEAWALNVGPGEDDVLPPHTATGSGPVLRAVAAEDTGRQGAFSGDRTTNEVRLDTTSDYEVLPVELNGAPGSERSFDIAVRNNGPGDPGQSGKLVFTLPPGTTVRKEPMLNAEEEAARMRAGRTPASWSASGPEKRRSSPSPCGSASPARAV
ncbi:hypothetical protein [Streptomyces spongiae]|uniref:DUF11 domain-containing protein n=1 Tax=Streptomyces spongiae TaxID=565072 RepID=A0A5N8XCJ7_9ACTN|nr:hypothetical protein [Streptomyces spongiae]MPY56255.1 hypothetical protein [Streptomyces spongiae]